MLHYINTIYIKLCINTKALFEMVHYIAIIYVILLQWTLCNLQCITQYVMSIHLCHLCGYKYNDLFLI